MNWFPPGADTAPWNRIRQRDTARPWGVEQSWVSLWSLCAAYWVSHDRSFCKGLDIWWPIQAEAQYTRQSTPREDGTVKHCLHVMTSRHLCFVEALVLSWALLSSPSSFLTFQRKWRILINTNPGFCTQMTWFYWLKRNGGVSDDEFPRFLIL